MELFVPEKLEAIMRIAISRHIYLHNFLYRKMTENELMLHMHMKWIHLTQCFKKKSQLQHNITGMIYVSFKKHCNWHTLLETHTYVI